VPDTSATAVILTALLAETKAVLRHMKEVKSEVVGTTTFQVGSFGIWRIAVVEVGAGNTAAAAIGTLALGHYKPRVALFVGVAGGIKDVDIGDVVVATKVYGYESGKDTPEGFRPRPEVFRTSHRIEQCVRGFRLRTTWTKRLDPTLGHQDLEISVGPIAAGEQVVASAEGKTAQFLKQYYGDALAVEMEGRGFLEGVHISHPVQGGVVRGISDMLSGKSAADKAGSQLLASDAASAVAFEILAELAKESPLPGPAKRASLYAIAALLILGWWAHLLYSARETASVIFRAEGSLSEQLVYRILSYTPEEWLKRRIKDGSTVYGRFGSLENFANVIAFRAIPLQVRPAPGWTPPQPDKISIQVDYERWKKILQTTGPRILIETSETQYTGDLEELNRCRDAAKARGGRPGTIPVPPFEAIGSIEPPSACWLFLEPRKSSMTIAELLEKVERVSAWQWTTYFKPSPYIWFAAETADGVVSNMIGYLWDDRLYFSRQVFPALSIEDEDCDKFGTCVVYSRNPKIVAGTQEIRDQLPIDKDIVRTAFLKSDQLYLWSDVPSHGYVKNLKIIFPLNYDMSQYMEIVRMAEPFDVFRLRRAFKACLLS
jgi:nucleoside phosphorylase